MMILSDAEVPDDVICNITIYAYDTTLYSLVLYVYKSTIWSCMEYCCHVWSGASGCYLEFLDKL